MSFPSPLQLVLDPAAVLHHRSAPVKNFDGQLRQLIDEMYQRCEEWSGVGLAAPQVGLNLQLAVIVYEGRRFTICNPQVVSAEGEVDALEGCLSLPGHHGLIRRRERITIRYRNAQGRGVVRSFEDWLARIVQHETDHLLGILCPEKLAPGATFEEVLEEDAEPSEGAAGEQPQKKPRSRRARVTATPPADA